MAMRFIYQMHLLRYNIKMPALSPSLFAVALIVLSSCGRAAAFVPSGAPQQQLHRQHHYHHYHHYHHFHHHLSLDPRLRQLAASSESAEAGPTDSTGEQSDDPSTMRLGEIQAELKQLQVSYADCFDKESLQKRLKDARDGLVEPQPSEEAKKSEESATASGRKNSKEDDTSSSPSSNSSSGTFDRDAVLAELRCLRVKELRTKLSERNLRWAGLLEKEDLVRALADALERASNFSPSGALEPGKVADIDDEQLEAEIKRAKDVGTPLLLDVYATWCGPCQLMAPQLAAAASELGDSVRVAKIDSDKYQNWAAELRVGGLPTVLVFDSEGKEVNRVEGALMKDGLLDLVRPHM